MGADLAAEEQFGPYLVYERLGVGGMATVHRALERGIEGFERIVALKRLLPHLAEDASFIKAFVREAKLASLLNHHNIVQIYELGRVGTEYFISMEHIDGRDIRRILRHARKVSGAPPIHITVGILIQLCDALDYAHTKVDDEGHPLGLVHRDVSPSNLLVTQAGHLKVIDFGIAKAQSSQLRTQTGRVKGKLAYMAPEAVSGRDLDARSDLWAVGVIAHELLTARPLFATKNEYQTLIKVQRGDILPPSTFNQTCPPELDAIVAKALARDPDERFSDAAVFREALVDLRKKQKLQTGYRDVAQWLEWAFSLEAPSGGFERGATQNTGGSGGFDIAAAARSLAGMSLNSFGHLTPTPKPRREDDEAVEIAWGTGDGSSVSRPIELDDVPDVSDKHLTAAPRIDHVGEDHGDDIPASEPSHGIARPKRDTSPEHAQTQPIAPFPLPRPGRPSDPIRERKSTEPGHAEKGTRAETDKTPEPAYGAATPVPSEPAPERTSADELPAAAAKPPRALSEISIGLPREVIRFREPTKPPPARPAALDEEEQITTLNETDAISTKPRKRREPKASVVAIGAAIVERESVRSRAWMGFVGLAILAAGGVAVALFVMHDNAEPGSASTAGAGIKTKTDAVPPVKKLGTVKFQIEPTDVSIQIEGQSHTGSPWVTELEPGVHQIEIRRDGYKTRVASIELSANEIQTLLINLDKAPRKVGSVLVAQQANLILKSTPAGLDVVLDNLPTGEKTPTTRTISAGPHVIALRQNGVEVWRQRLVAEADADHEFNPTFNEEKQRLRRQRTVAQKDPGLRNVTPGSAQPTGEAAPANPPPPTPKIEPQIEPKIEPKVEPKIEPKIEPQVVPTKPIPPKPIAPTGPVTVAPTAVRRVFGESPTLGASRPQDMPSVIAARVCIDANGTVTTVAILAKLERHTTADLTDAIKSWRYAPYQQNGQPVGACFAVSFRVK